MHDVAAATYALMGGGWPQSFTIEGKPVVKKRPRVTRGGQRTYSPSRAAEVALGLELRAQGAEMIEGEVVLLCVFYLPNLQHRPDFDNLAKHVSDACNGVIFRDDKQVTAAQQFIELDRERPRTLILAGPREGGSIGS